MLVMLPFIFHSPPQWAVADQKLVLLGTELLLYLNILCEESEELMGSFQVSVLEKKRMLPLYAH